MNHFSTIQYLDREIGSTYPCLLLSLKTFEDILKYPSYAFRKFVKTPPCFAAIIEYQIVGQELSLIFSDCRESEKLLPFLALLSL